MAARVPAHARAGRLAAARAGAGTIAGWPARRWIVAALAAAATALAIGIPTGIVETSWYTRMTAVTWWNYPVWAITAILAGLIAATYVRYGEPRRSPDRSRQALLASLLSTFAVGCPICNKLVVALIGASGALSYWAPLQPILGLAGLALLAGALAVRLRGAVECAS